MSRCGRFYFGTNTKMSMTDREALDYLRALRAETADEAYKKGVEMTFNQLMDVFGKLGVEPIESVGKPFDPNLHNAVMHVEDPDRGENEIVEEFQKGFKIGDKVIRFSMVKVAN